MNKKINCIAVDDEPLALEKMCHYIDKIEYLNLLETFDCGVDALNFLKNNTVDLMFLDIQMNDLTGIQLLESIQNKPKVIITTAYDSYAIKGYELDVNDYLLKPISLQRFIKSVDKIYETIQGSEELIVQPIIDNKEQRYSNDFIFVKTEYRIERLNLSDIIYVEGMKDYLRIHTNEKRIMILQNFKTLLKYLPESNFIRVHRSYIVAIDKIESVERKTINIHGIKIPIGESYREYFFQVLKRRNLIL